MWLLEDLKILKKDGKMLSITMTVMKTLGTATLQREKNGLQLTGLLINLYSVYFFNYYKYIYIRFIKL